MSTLTTRPMSLVDVDFAELYARHLCRHSQFGINLAHLVALFGVWFGAYGFVYWVVRAEWVPIGPVRPEWVPIALAVAYLAELLPSVPPRVWAATAVFLALFLATLFWLPGLPFWVYLLMVPVFYKLQALSHKVYTVERDMTDFNAKYTKGFVLFVLLLFLEVPFLLNYFVFDRKNWAK